MMRDLFLRKVNYFYEYLKKLNSRTSINSSQKEAEEFSRETGIVEMVNEMESVFFEFIDWLLIDEKSIFNKKWMVEFKFSFLYIKEYLKQSNNILNNFQETKFYMPLHHNIKSFILFIYSLLDKATTLNFMLSEYNKFEFDMFNETEWEVIENKIKNISFSKKKYNEFIDDFNYPIFNDGIKDARNIFEHRTIFFTIDNYSQIWTSNFHFKEHIWILIYIVLYYLIKLTSKWDKLTIRELPKNLYAKMLQK
ncbi:hypothetical protein STIUS_v1c01940 [Spiroplasma sp. TIUS-1]|uniref:hypothetical protein n=1 Tax=Spiroplasma sp. TIUS-1 TaxID=216963 RepID=UPI0013980058|nr:hypothetical protein [Spiroplasma sp. TIUS-1]QHX35749.1 hypothetical protein STIUS_v1c01940 [Spiroplasma sp. TIUS-1]